MKVGRQEIGHSGMKVGRCKWAGYRVQWDRSRTGGCRTVEMGRKRGTGGGSRTKYVDRK